MLSEAANEDENKLGDVKPVGEDWRKQDKDPMGKENKEKHMGVKQICFEDVNCDLIETPIKKGPNESKVTSWTDILTKNKKKTY